MIKASVDSQVAKAKKAFKRLGFGDVHTTATFTHDNGAVCVRISNGRDWADYNISHHKVILMQTSDWHSSPAHDN